MAWAGAVISLIGGAVGASGQREAGEAGGKAYDFNATINEQNAVRAREAADAYILSQKRDATRAVGAQQAGYAASGVSGGSGSALDVLADSTTQALLDQHRRKYQGELEYQDQMNQAKVNRMNARTVRKGGQAAAAATVLGAVGSAASRVKTD